MDDSRIDALSGLQENIISEIVYCFFPMSDRNIGSGRRSKSKGKPIFEWRDNAEVIYSGSSQENLMLPTLLHRFNSTEHGVKPSMLWSDSDRMINEFSEIDENFSLEIDKDRPVFCRIRHGIPVNTRQFLLQEFKHGSYLSSAAVKTYFEGQRYFIKSKSDLKRHVAITLEKEYSSSSLAADISYFGKTPLSSDTVFCVRVRLEENMKTDFLKRLRKNKWPLNMLTTIDRILTEHVYAIPKPDPNSETGDLRWRLSFSAIEVELAQTLTDIQRRCYRVLKAMIKYEVNEALPKDTEKYPSYYLKTLMFWLCENSSEDSWKIQNFGRQWFALLDNVIESLDKKNLPHFFVKSYNLLDGKSQRVISLWSKKLKKIRVKPLETFIIFWSKYRMNDGIIDWGQLFTELLYHLVLANSEHAPIAGPENKQRQKCKKQAERKVSLSLQMALAEYLLTENCLSSFLIFQKLHPQMNKIIDVSHAQSQEHIIWIYYTRRWKELLLADATTEISSWMGNFTSLWTFLAELTHHMVLKYRQKVPNKYLFSTKTVEQFHLISYCIGNETVVAEGNTVRYYTYANFLRLEKRYEEAVQILMQFCQTRKFAAHPLSYFISRVTSEVLDVCLKLELAVLDEIDHSQTYYVYHILTCCYTEAGILSEVHIPENRETLDLKIAFPQESYSAVNKATLGFQLILSGKHEQAFNSFANLSMQEMTKDDELHGSIKYTAMLYILAKCST